MADVAAAHRGQMAMEASDYSAAITHFETAIAITESPIWLIARGTAYQRTKQYPLALADAERAVLAATKRAKRDLIGKAQFRRALALHGLKRYGDARMCLVWAQKYNEKEKGLTIWQAKIKNNFDDAGGDDAECNKVTVKMVPDKIEETQKPVKASEVSEEKIQAKKTTAASAPVAAVMASTPVNKIRTEWFQASDSITIEIFAKGIKQENLEVVIQETHLGISFPVATGGTYDYTLDPLYHPIDHTNSSYRLTPHKIEITLKKKTSNLKWTSLEGEAKPEPASSAPEPTSTTTTPVSNTLTSNPEVAPAYPTSSKTGAKNWDKLADENDEKEEGDVDSFFKQLYKGADPDTRRAMMKSFQESNGTSLSTNWSDVGSKTFKTDPPEGMEAKSWGT